MLAISDVVYFLHFHIEPSSLTFEIPHHATSKANEILPLLLEHVGNYFIPLLQFCNAKQHYSMCKQHIYKYLILF